MHISKSLAWLFLLLVAPFAPALGDGLAKRGTVCHRKNIEGLEGIKASTKELIKRQGQGHFVYLKIAKDAEGNEVAVYFQSSAKSTRSSPEERGNYITALVEIEKSNNATKIETVVEAIHKETDMSGSPIRDATFLLGPSFLSSEALTQFRQEILRRGNYKILAEDTSNETKLGHIPDVYDTAAIDDRNIDGPFVVRGIKQAELREANSLVDAAASYGLSLALATYDDGLSINNGTVVLPLNRARMIGPFLNFLSTLNAQQRDRVVADLLSKENLVAEDFEELIASGVLTRNDDYDAQVFLSESSPGEFMAHTEEGLRPLSSILEQGKTYGRLDISSLSDDQILDLGGKLNTQWADLHRVFLTGITYRTEAGQQVTSKQRSESLEGWKRVNLLADGSVENIRGARESMQKVKELESSTTSESDVVVELVHNDGGEALLGIADRAAEGRYKGRHVALLICPLDGRKLLELRRVLFENGVLSFTVPIPVKGATHIDAPTATLVMTECRENPAIRTSRTPGMFVRAAVKSVRRRVANVLKLESKEDRTNAIAELINRYGKGPLSEAIPLRGGADLDPGSVDTIEALRELEVRLEAFEQLLIELVLNVPNTNSFQRSAIPLLANNKIDAFSSCRVARDA